MGKAFLPAAARPGRVCSECRRDQVLLLMALIFALVVLVTVNAKMMGWGVTFQSPAAGDRDALIVQGLRQELWQELQVAKRVSDLEDKQNLTGWWWDEVKQEMQRVQGELQSLHDAIKGLNSSKMGLQGEGKRLLPSAMVIVEPRRHDQLQYVLENFHAIMPQHYALYIFHGKTAGNFAATAAAQVGRRRRVTLVPLEEDELSREDYNQLLKSRAEFWDRIDAENVLVFQTDSVLCGASPWRIADFEHLDYVGCAYDRTSGRKNCCWERDAFWGVGGLSFRKKSTALRCLAEVPHEPSFPEDIFFSNCVDAGLGRHADNGMHISEFCSQSNFFGRSFGAHSLAIMDSKQLGAFLAYCPEARPVAPEPPEEAAAHSA